MVLGGGRFLMSEVALYESSHHAFWLVAVVFDHLFNRCVCTTAPFSFDYSRRVPYQAPKKLA